VGTGKTRGWITPPKTLKDEWETLPKAPWDNSGRKEKTKLGGQNNTLPGGPKTLKLSKKGKNFKGKKAQSPK